MKGEELVHTFKEKRAAERLKTEGRLLGNMERSQRTMEKYVLYIVAAKSQTVRV